MKAHAAVPVKESEVNFSFEGGGKSEKGLNSFENCGVYFVLILEIAIILLGQNVKFLYLFNSD